MLETIHNNLNTNSKEASSRGVIDKFNKHLNLAADDGCIEVVEFLLTSGKCFIEEAVCEAVLRNQGLSVEQKKC